jgi:hypothetical protein
LIFVAAGWQQDLAELARSSRAGTGELAENGSGDGVPRLAAAALWIRARLQLAEIFASGRGHPLETPSLRSVSTFVVR